MSHHESPAPFPHTRGSVPTSSPRGSQAQRTVSLQHHGGDVVSQGRGVRHGQGGRVRLQGGVGGPVPGALLMGAQPGQLGVGTLADLALVRALAGVEPHVVAQGGGLAEAAVAEAADEGLVQSVDAHVGPEVAARIEPTVADDAAHAPRATGTCLHHMEVLCMAKKKGRNVIPGDNELCFSVITVLQRQHE